MNPDGILTYAGNVGLPMPVYAAAGLAALGLLPRGLRLSPADLGIAGYQMTDLDTLRSVDALETYDAELRGRAKELDEEFAGLPMPDEAMEEFKAIGDALVAIEARRNELNARAEFIRTISSQPANAVSGAFEAPNVHKNPGDIFDLAAYRQRVGSIDDLPKAYREGAMRALDGAVFPTTAKAKAIEHIGQLLDADVQIGRDGKSALGGTPGILARRVLGTGSPAYAEAFGHYVTGGREAVPARLMAAFQTYTDADGGYAIPFQIDPTFILTSDGVINPLRTKARVVQTTAKEWRGITTAGVTAAYGVEVAGAADVAPTDVDGPLVTPVRAHVWVPFTAEYAEDYGAQLQGEIGGLIQDAKDVLEGAKFVTGSGTNEPEGIIWKLDDDGTSLVDTAGSGTYTRPDLNTLEAAVPPRFRAKASIAMQKAIAQLTKAFGTAGEPANSLFDGAAGTLLGYPDFELSAMDASIVAGKEIVLMGDFSKFVIVDRIGLSVEYVPQVFDGSGLPLGQRGIYARWRNSSKVLVINAFRLLKVKA